MKYIIQYDEFIIILDTLKECISFISTMLTDHEHAKFILKELVDLHEESVYRVIKTYHIDNKEALEVFNNQD